MPRLSNPGEQNHSPKVSLLLVDDNETSLHITADFLCRHDDLSVVGATGGRKEALVQAQDLQSQVILIGLDKPAFETISRLRKVLPGVGIIALTLLNNNAYRQAAMAAGADDLVHKAALVTDLLPAIRRVTQERLP